MKALTLCFHTKLLLSKVVHFCFTGEVYIRRYPETSRKGHFPLNLADCLYTDVWFHDWQTFLSTTFSQPTNAVADDDKNWDVAAFIYFFRLCDCSQHSVANRTVAIHRVVYVRQLWKMVNMISNTCVNILKLLIFSNQGSKTQRSSLNNHSRLRTSADMLI